MDVNGRASEALDVAALLGHQGPPVDEVAPEALNVAALLGHQGPPVDEVINPSANAIDLAFDLLAMGDAPIHGPHLGDQVAHHAPLHGGVDVHIPVNPPVAVDPNGLGVLAPGTACLNGALASVEERLRSAFQHCLASARNTSSLEASDLAWPELAVRTIDYFTEFLSTSIIEIRDSYVAIAVQDYQAARLDADRDFGELEQLDGEGEAQAALDPDVHVNAQAALDPDAPGNAQALAPEVLVFHPAPPGPAHVCHYWVDGFNSYELSRDDRINMFPVTLKFPQFVTVPNRLSMYGVTGGQTIAQLADSVLEKFAVSGHVAPSAQIVFRTDGNEEVPDGTFLGQVLMRNPASSVGVVLSCHFIV